MTYLFTGILGLLGLHGYVAAGALQLRNSPNSMNVKGGILVRDGKRTSCELGVVDSQSAIVSALCMGFTASDETLSDVKFEAYLDAGGDGEYAKYSVEKVTVHPHYNSTTFANDIAIISYNSGGNVKWQNPIAPVYGYKWDSVAFVRRSLLDMEKPTWDTLQYSDAPYSGNVSNVDDYCPETSVLYQDNNQELLCSQLRLSSPSNDLTSCRISYGILYGLLDNQTYLIGIFSYAGAGVIKFLCIDYKFTSYFTQVAPYLPYIEQVLGRSVKYDIKDFSGGTQATNSSYSMLSDRKEAFASLVYAGDFFKNQSDSVTIEPNGVFVSVAFSSEESNSSETGIDSAASSLTANNPNSGGLSRTKQIIIGVCVSVGGLLLIGGTAAAMLVRRRKAKARTALLNQQDIQDAMVIDSGNQEPVPAYEPPPVYRKTSGTERNASASTSKKNADAGLRDKK
ncbi:hypothetical protein IWW55_000251 [Coemansia sp. RSA 2706]|nr:hypothetical protein IWW55_000251 [Coemansia sp. RSA 2706]